MINLLALGYFSAIVIAQPLESPGCSTSWQVGQAVTTQNGIISGRAAANTNVSEYLGIPYAKPPTGSLRFEPPQELDAIHDINATAFVSLQEYLLGTRSPIVWSVCQLHITDTLSLVGIRLCAARRYWFRW